MHFAFLGKQLLMSRKFYVCEGFLTFFLRLFIQGIFINKKSDVRASNLNLLFPGPIAVRNFQHYFFELFFFATGVFYSKSRNREYSSLSLFCFFSLGWF